jgi:hypothetical protein
VLEKDLPIETAGLEESTGQHDPAQLFIALETCFVDDESE